MPVDGKSMVRLRYLLCLGVLAGGASLARTAPAPGVDPPQAEAGSLKSDVSVLTYNVKGLPWPIASGREAALEAIADRLARQRRAGVQPSVVVLQEAFTPEARSIGRRAGYAFQVHGPYLRTAAGERPEAGGAWHLGETGPSQVDSGLIVLSDLPVLSVERAEFPSGSCAGFDCLAAKGVLLVTLDVPGKGPIAIAATHLNSRKASGAPFARTHAAYRRQAGFMAEFLAARRPPDVPLVLAGDFNCGQRPVRISALGDALARIAGKARPREALRSVAASTGDLGNGRRADVDWIVGRGRDMQFLFDGTRRSLAPVGAEIPFGRESDGSMLSDHMGFTIHYRIG